MEPCKTGVMNAMMSGSESEAAQPVRVRLGLSQAPAHEHWPDLARPRMLSSAVT
jgi:hypothetical protein